MALDLLPAFQAASKRFRQPENSARFSEDFPYCVNLVLGELSFIADLATPITPIENQQDSISELDAEHLWILDAGLDYFLMRQGYAPAVGKVALPLAKDDWENARDSYLTMLRREDQEDVDDDDVSEDDIIGLGYKED